MTFLQGQGPQEDWHTIRAKIIAYSILKTINPVRLCVSDG